ncbi:fructoselysine 6-kinase [Neobacillus vireti]|uniref:fructoselysine 6-kinase n=1 Tax=Neobacillus vireti TaxID=220686 RepID=UPI002FFEEFF0
MRIAALGFCCIDVYENINRHYATGNGIDCIINLSKKGIKSSAVTVVGTDQYGKEMLETLNNYNIDTSHIQVRDGYTSIYRMTLKNGTDRVHLENIEGVMENYAPTPEDIEFVKQHEFVHTDLTGKVLHLLPEIKNAGCKIVFDFSIRKNEDDLQKILPYVHYAFFSCEKKDDSIKDFLIYAKSFGPELVTATYGEEGSMCYDGDNFYEHGINTVPVINTVGAGDSFIAGFIYGIMQGWDIPACLKSGADLSSEIVQLFNPY